MNCWLVRPREQAVDCADRIFYRLVFGVLARF